MHAGSLALGAPRPRLLVPRGRGACQNNTRANSSFLESRHHGILSVPILPFWGQDIMAYLNVPILPSWGQDITAYLSK